MNESKENSITWIFLFNQLKKKQNETKKHSADMGNFYDTILSGNGYTVSFLQYFRNTIFLQDRHRCAVFCLWNFQRISGLENK